MASRVRILHVLALVAGAIGLVVLLDRVGWSGMRDAVVNAGWWFAVIAVIDLAGVACDAAAVHALARRDTEVSYGRVFLAQASGMAINRLTPGNSLGEPIKVTMLVDHMPKDAAVAAILKYNLVTLYVALAVIVTGVPLTLLALDLPTRLSIAVGVATAMLVIAALALALVVRRGAIATVIHGAARIRLISAARAARWVTQTTAIDGSVRSFADPWSRRGVAFAVASRALSCMTAIAVLAAAAITPTPALVLGMCSVGILVTWLASVVPLGLGVADGTNYFLYGVLGAAPAAGLVFTTVNRARTLVLAAIGLAIMLLVNVMARRAARVR